jgi:hypothetical protein
VFGGVVGVEGLVDEFGLLLSDEKRVCQVHKCCKGSNIRVICLERCRNVECSRIGAQELGDVAQEVDKKLVGDIFRFCGLRESLDAGWVAVRNGNVVTIHGPSGFPPENGVTSEQAGSVENRTKRHYMVQGDEAV